MTVLCSVIKHAEIAVARAQKKCRGKHMTQCFLSAPAAF